LGRLVGPWRFYHRMGGEGAMKTIDRPILAP
jgi:hypothetical protein